MIEHAFDTRNKFARLRWDIEEFSKTVISSAKKMCGVACEKRKEAIRNDATYVLPVRVSQ